MNFEVYYQPITDISNRECMLRCRSTDPLEFEELGVISPTEFIPLAEYLGLINPIGSFHLKGGLHALQILE